MGFTREESENCRRLVERALIEDLGTAGDVTTRLLIDEDRTGRAELVARQPGVLAGMPAAAVVLHAFDSRLHFEPLLEDGVALQTGARIGVVSGPLRSLLTVERTLLNFMQRLSGIATLTRTFVDAIAGSPGKILDTRKTIPGWRFLDKYAVRMGGGLNHRLGLYDGVLIKDNHLAALGPNAIETAVKKARTLEELTIEVEVDTLEQFDVALACAPDIILLDNFSPADMREAVARRNRQAAEILLEASGGVSLDSVRIVAETGVERISIGALTHSAPALDIALDDC